MSASTKKTSSRGVEIEDDSANEIRLRGRLSGVPEERVLPSGDTLWTFRVVVPRPPGRAADAGRARVDPLECAVWAPRLRRSVAAWGDGDTVEVQGSLRRRFYRAGEATVSRVEVEVERARLIRRSATA